MRYTSKVCCLGALVGLVFFLAGCGSDTGPTDRGLPDTGSDATADTDILSPDVTPRDVGDTESVDGDVAEPEYIDVEPELTKAVTERGQYNVGYRTWTVEYDPRGDGEDKLRKIDVAVWYPTLRKDGPSAQYYNGLITREEVIAQPKVAPVEKAPLFVFSHGSGSIPEQSIFMTEYFASHGWIVVAPTHVGNTVAEGFNVTFEVALYRPQDITATLDYIDELPEDDPIGRRLTDNVLMSGHSFGGYTTFANAGAEYSIERLRRRCNSNETDSEACEAFQETDSFPQVFDEGFEDDRIDVAIPQAPPGAEAFHTGLGKLDIPTMLFTGGIDKTLPNDEQGDPIWRFMAGPQHRRVHLPKGGHFTFSDACEFFGGQARIRKDGCEDYNIPYERAHQIVNAYSMAFARFHLDLEKQQRAEKIIDGDIYPVGQDGFEFKIGADAESVQ